MPEVYPTFEVSPGQEIVGRCHECDTPLNECGEYKVVEEHSYCLGCFYDIFTFCCECCEICFTDDAIFDEDGDSWCIDCFNANHTECVCCGGMFVIENMYTVSYAESVCETCFREEYFTCCACGRVAENDTISWVHDEPYCQSCAREARGRSADLHQWNFKPRFRIYGSAKRHIPTYGCEVEVNTEHHDFDEAVEVFDGSEFYYLAEDGSIHDGFEVITHPFTLDWAKSSREIMQPLFDLRGKVRGFQAKDCGMHIHVGRNAFFGTTHLYKFCNLFLDNYTFTLKISRRPSSTLLQWASVDAWNLKNIIKFRNGGERYKAVNLQNNDTVEVRIFQSTVSPQGFFANLECVDGVVAFTRDISLRDCTVENYIEFMNRHKKQYPNFGSLFLSHDSRRSLYNIENSE